MRRTISTKKSSKATLSLPAKPPWEDTAPKVEAAVVAKAPAALLRCLIVAIALSVSLLASAGAWAQDTAGRVTVRGNYYREHSTRVLQPLVSFDKGLAGGKVSVGVEYALDAISSA